MLLFTTHTNASYVSTNLSEVAASQEARTQQFLLVRDFINAKVDLFAQEEPLVVLSGDMNINSNENLALKKLK